MPLNSYAQHIHSKCTNSLSQFMLADASHNLTLSVCRALFTHRHVELIVDVCCIGLWLNCLSCGSQIVSVVLQNVGAGHDSNCTCKCHCVFANVCLELCLAKFCLMCIAL